MEPAGYPRPVCLICSDKAMLIPHGCLPRPRNLRRGLPLCGFEAAAFGLPSPALASHGAGRGPSSLARGLIAFVDVVASLQCMDYGLRSSPLLVLHPHPQSVAFRSLAVLPPETCPGGFITMSLASSRLFCPVVSSHVPMFCLPSLFKPLPLLKHSPAFLSPSLPRW